MKPDHHRLLACKAILAELDATTIGDLTPAATATLVARARSGDMAAVDAIVQLFDHAIAQEAWSKRGFIRHDLSHDDVRHEGVLGIFRAIRRWKPEKSSFAWYGKMWARTRMCRAMECIGTTIRAPVGSSRRLRKAKRAGALTDLDVAAEHALFPAHLDAPLEAGSDFTLADTLADAGPTAERVMQRDQERRGLRRALCTAPLSDQERTVIERLFLTENPPTSDQLGKELGVSGQRVRQIRARALAKLRKHLKTRGITSTDLLEDT